MFPTAFTKTLHTLDRPGLGAAFFRLALALLLLAVLGYWAVRVPVALYETSTDARLEISASATIVQSSMTGRIVESNLALGRKVAKGDVLLRMDSRPEQLAVREQQARISSIEPQIQALNSQIAEEEATGIAEQRASVSAVEEAKQKVREAETPAKAARLERQRYERLKREGLAPDREVEKAIAESEQRDQAVLTARAAIDRLEREQKTRDQQRLVRIATIRTEITRLQTAKSEAKASVERAGYDVELREIRAPVGGTIGEASVLLPGSVLREGTRVAAIVPSGNLRIVAFFPPQSAHGRIQPEAKAKLRLKGYPWTEFGAVEARVTHVALESVDGRGARVELEVLDSPTLKVAPSHGMPGELEVEVERTPPLHLIMRTAGQWLTTVRKP
jgi:multidrug resistance efflux pump